MMSLIFTKLMSELMFVVSSSKTLLSYIYIFLPFNFTIALITVYLLISIPLYIVATRANYSRPWLAFLPIGNDILITDLGNTPITFFLGLFGISVVSLVLNNVVIGSILYILIIVLRSLIYFQFLRNFNIGMVGLVVAMFIHPVCLYWYIIITNKTFVGYQNNNFTRQ